MTTRMSFVILQIRCNKVLPTASEIRDQNEQIASMGHALLCAARALLDVLRLDPRFPADLRH